MQVDCSLSTLQEVRPNLTLSIITFLGGISPHSRTPQVASSFSVLQNLSVQKKQKSSKSMITSTDFPLPSRFCWLHLKVFDAASSSPHCPKRAKKDNPFASFFCPEKISGDDWSDRAQPLDAADGSFFGSESVLPHPERQGNGSNPISTYNRTNFSKQSFPPSWKRMCARLSARMQ